MPLLLKEALSHHTVDGLKDLLKLIPGGSTVGRKDELVGQLFAAMCGDELFGAGLRERWADLDETQQAAVAEAACHPRGLFEKSRFSAKYGRSPVFSVPGKSFGYSKSVPTPLCLFLYYSSDDRNYYVPADLIPRLKTFVPQPVGVTLASSEALEAVEGQTIRPTERDALLEVVVMLRTIEQERVQVSDKTALPGAATLRLLTGKLVGGDFYPWEEKVNKWDQEVAPIKAFAWPMLLQAGGLAALSGSRLTLTPAGVKALGAAPADVLRGLWRKWLKTTLLDEFSRVDVIKGQNGKGRVMSAVAPRRAAIESALRDCPVGRWVRRNDFSRFMRATDRDFNVALDHWRLYIADREYGALGYDGFGGWNILQGRYLAALLFEYAATLGMVDVAYFHPADTEGDFHDIWGTDDLEFLSRYDGLEAIRLTPLGAYVLGLSDAYQPVAVAGNAVLAVMPNLLVNLASGELGPEESLLLETWAEPVQPGSWRLEREKSLAAIEKGHDIKELRDFLESRDDNPLPEKVDAFIRHCERNGKALKIGASAILIECRDAEVADTVATHKETAGLCLRAGPKTLAVRSEHLDKFRAKVRVLGFGAA